VLVGLVGDEVQVGAWVEVFVGGLGVLEGGKVRVMVKVALGRGVRVAVRVGDGPAVTVEVLVEVDVRVGAAVGGVPVTVNRPETCHCIPRKTWTSNSPGNHSLESGSHSEYP